LGLLLCLCCRVGSESILDHGVRRHV
jgi:hypothetical protein